MPEATESEFGGMRGSVIQRTLIPEGFTAVLNVATAPLHDLESEPEHMDFPRLVANVLGVAEESILRDDVYERLAPRLRDGSIWRPLPNRFWLDWEYTWRQLRRGRSDTRPFGDGSTSLLTSDALALMLRPHATFPFPFADFITDETSEESAELALRCFIAGNSPTERVDAFVRRVATYDIPSGQSPATASDHLAKIISGSSKACLAPLLVGATSGATQLTQGAFVNALLYTGTGAGMSLVLIGTVAVADYLVQYMRHRAPARRPKDDPHPPPSRRPRSPKRGR